MPGSRILCPDSIRAELAPGESLVTRYSPGYGDLPLSIQRPLLDLLNAQRAIGLTLTPTNLMVPRKSVTAVMGVCDTPKESVLGNCTHCPLKSKCSFRARGLAVLETDARSGKGINGFVPAVRALLADKLADYERKGQSGRGLKIMVLGIPNVGKSTFINKVAGRKAAAAGDKPGVTRGRQWINIDRGLDMLDTPGILWPKFDSQEVGEMLAVTNAIKSDVLDRETLAANFMLRLRELYPEALESRYGIKPTGDENGFELLELAAKRRGFLVSRGEYDIERMANTLLDEYHSGKLGRLSLERPE